MLLRIARVGVERSRRVLRTPINFHEGQYHRESETVGPLRPVSRAHGGRPDQSAFAIYFQKVARAFIIGFIGVAQGGAEYVART